VDFKVQHNDDSSTFAIEKQLGLKPWIIARFI
jgi:hypothetical protein